MDQCDNHVCTRVLFAIKCHFLSIKVAIKIFKTKNSFKQPSCNTQPKKSQIYASNDNEKIASCSQYQSMHAYVRRWCCHVCATKNNCLSIFSDRKIVSLACGEILLYEKLTRCSCRSNFKATIYEWGNFLKLQFLIHASHKKREEEKQSINS